ncbi:hypothetical protein C8F04DRAFT_1402352 [Mycena alexandri]|uniref:Uncharacterized protein n=1 Tax=Mycena alexandri TaxID=1745969 RepID=A0AAD6SA02_9AGAR|nr:hypothetical protein C8F04DRAFT_1402352 [Mycena alexandri]
MENPDLNVNNAAVELEKTDHLLKAFSKKNKADRKKAGGTPYKERLEERIAKCHALIGQSTMNSNALTLPGSPNDSPIIPGGGPQHSEQLSKEVLDARAAAAAAAAQQNPAIGSALNDLELPPSKRSRANNGQPMHRKIIEEDPIDVIANSINARMISTFTTAWRTYETVLQKVNPSTTAEGFEDLYEAAIDIIDQVGKVVEDLGLSYAELKWNVEYMDGGPVKVSDLIALRHWLIASGIMVGDIQPAPAGAKEVKKVSTEPKIKILVNGKKRTMTSAMMTEARTNPKMFPGCVEAGMKTVAAIFTNRSGRKKCVSCDSIRGKALDSKPIPPPSDGPFLADCKCPLRGAALELWMIKMTAHMEGIPQRGVDDIKNKRLALNPDTLKLIAGAVQAVSGHEVETLLEPEVTRLELTVHWALKELTLIADHNDSQYAASFRHLLTRFKETMVAWEKEE